MNQTERQIAEAVLSVILFLVPAFLFHTAPRFAGSLMGFVLGVAAATLMVSLLIYPLVKYAGWLKRWVTRIVSLRALLTFHVYAGVFGAFLAILHTGHKYQSQLGIALLVVMLIVVATGFVGRYYLPQTSLELREAESHLGTLRATYNQAAEALAERQALEEAAAANISAPALQNVSMAQVVEGIADLEYAIGSREILKKVSMRWIVAHVVAAILMYTLLALHVAGEIYYGLRWLS
ncbi:iron reductase [Bradyrhizobium sp.]|jgi:hypothetical protein|uniref:iron reductase n=1 Tax=Bradyrhizobium sp. TaxID=376 RepID=UPI00391AB54E